MILPTGDGAAVCVMMPPRREVGECVGDDDDEGDGTGVRRSWRRSWEEEDMWEL